MSPKRSTTPVRSTKNTAQRSDALVESLGFNPSLPYAVFDERGGLITLNARMEKLLGAKPSPDFKLPLAPAAVQALWPFQNESESQVAHFKRVVLSPFTDASLRSSVAVARLKNFRIYVKQLPASRSAKKLRLVVAEMLRTGDLMSDEGSRQELFRSLSHEIRTSVTALKGYVTILEEKARGREISTYVNRLGPTLARLDSVVERLQDFKVELEVLGSVRTAGKK